MRAHFIPGAACSAKSHCLPCRNTRRQGAFFEFPARRVRPTLPAPRASGKKSAVPADKKGSPEEYKNPKNIKNPCFTKRPPHPEKNRQTLRVSFLAQLYFLPIAPSLPAKNNKNAFRGMLTGKRKELLSGSDYFRRSLYRKICRTGKRLAFVKQTLFTRGVFYTTGDKENIKNRTNLLFCIRIRTLPIKRARICVPPKNFAFSSGV